MVTRSELRHIFAAAVEDAGKGIKVFNGRHIDSLHDNLPAAIIAFETIEAEMDLSDNFMFTGQIGVMLIVNGDDDLLDTYIDPVIANCMAWMRTQLPGTGCSLDSINYDREIDPGVAAASIVWTVQFNG